MIVENGYATEAGQRGSGIECQCRGCSASNRLVYPRLPLLTPFQRVRVTDKAQAQPLPHVVLGSHSQASCLY